MSRSLSHYLTRSAEELRSTVMLAKYVGIPDACVTLQGKLLIQRLCRTARLETPGNTKLLMRKHEVMRNYFDACLDLKGLELCRPDAIGVDNTDGRVPVWMMWLQGEASAPPIVKCCINSVRNNLGEDGYLVVIDESNLSQFIKFPEWIQDKLQKGVIDRTHLSDLVRLALLGLYGGLWLDATMFCAGSLTEVLHLPLFSIKRPDYGHRSVACGRFATYAMGASWDNRWIYAYIRDLFYAYWKNHDFLVDYLTQDYLIDYAIRHEKRVSERFMSIPNNNPQCDDLMPLMGEVFDLRKWHELNCKTSLFKLTWKRNIESALKDKRSFASHVLGSDL